MKKIIIISLALMLSLSAFSQTSGTGIGAALGSSLDFTAKFWTSETTAFAVAAGIDWGSYGGFHVSGDYLFHLWQWDVAQDMMKVYLGPGIGMGVHFNHDSPISMSLRAPGGVGYYFHNIPLECFAEIGPEVMLFSPWGFEPWWFSVIGARWYFN